MAKLDQYDDDAIAACKSVMVEVLTILGKHREHLIVVGGWVPPLLFGEGDHVGSIDVDLAIDWPVFPITSTRRSRMSCRPVGTGQSPVAHRIVSDATCSTAKIRIPSVSTSSRANRVNQRRGPIALYKACQCGAPRGSSVALDHFIETEVRGTLPLGGENVVSARVATAGAFLVMKGMALNERMKAKDAYDIYYCCLHYPSGIAGLAAELMPIMDIPVVTESLGHIRDKFATIESVGPVWAASVLREHGGDYDVARRDAFERVQALLRGSWRCLPDAVLSKTHPKRNCSDCNALSPSDPRVFIRSCGM